MEYTAMTVQAALRSLAYTLSEMESKNIPVSTMPQTATTTRESANPTTGPYTPVVKRAVKQLNGKGVAIREQELWAIAADMIYALNQLETNERALLVKYYVFDTDMNKIMKQMNIRSRTTFISRRKQALNSMVRILNYGSTR